MLLYKTSRLALQLIQVLPRLLQDLLLHLSRRFLLFDKLQVFFPLRSGALALLAKPPEFHARNGQALSGARVLLGELAIFMIERQSLALLRLQQPAQPLLFFRTPRDLAIQTLQQRGGLGNGSLPGLNLRGQFPQFALERQRTAAFFLPPADRVTVIADA